VTSGVAGLTFDSLVTNNPVTFTVGANANVSIPGVVSGTSGLTKNGVGMLTLTGANTYAGPTLVNAGALDVSPSAIPASNAVTVNNTGTYRMNGGSGALFDIGSLTVNGGGAARINTPAGANAILAVDALSVLSNGLLHITDADLLWDYSGGTPYTTTKNLVALGSSTGTQGIVTSGAADQIYAVIDNAAGFGASDWRGIAVDGTTVICKLTYYGDGNLDGQVTTDDYVVVDLNLGSGTTSSASSSELFADDPEAVLALAEPPVVSKPPKVRKAGSRR
jgi:autotransporter-associated beta strand protein